MAEEETPLENALIAGFSILTGTLTIVSVTFTLYCYLRYKQLQVMEFTMIIFMLVGDLIITVDLVAIAIWYFALPHGVTVVPGVMC